MTIKAPFPWFGGKSRAAHLVWRAFGDVANYVEPFAGSLAVLLGRPTEPRIETVNDIDCYLSNFWRAVKLAPHLVAEAADWPVNEADLHARHRWLVNQVEFRRRMKHEPDFFDAKVAGWWVWGICQWIGGGWCAAPEWEGRANSGRRARGISTANEERRPQLMCGNGVHRRTLEVESQKRPHLWRGGTGSEHAGGFEVMSQFELTPVTHEELRRRKKRKAAKYSRQYRERHPDRPRAQQKAYRAKNREKVRAAHKKWAQNNKLALYRLKFAHRIRKYGLTVEDYARAELAQDRRCAGCLRPLGERYETAIDHCHATGRFRGLLCIRCNRGLGLVGDDPERLRRLAEYVERAR